MRLHSFILLAASLLVLAACGDSPDQAETPGPPPPPAPPSNEVPSSATVSTSAYVQYTGSLAASDSAEPLIVDKVIPPTSETEEPLVV